MELKIKFEKDQNVVGTLDWLLANADTIKIGTKNDCQTAWLLDKEGGSIMILAARDFYGEPDKDEFIGVAKVAKYSPDVQCSIPLTDAAWEIVNQLANLAAEQMEESAEQAKGIKISFTKDAE
jgi:hypothetical protein